jgi:hypothetical protein
MTNDGGPQFERSKRYFIKELSPDGLLKDVLGRWGDGSFSFYGYDSEEDAWSAIEKDIQLDVEAGRMPFHYRQFVVIQSWRVALAPQGGQDE